MGYYSINTQNASKINNSQHAPPSSSNSSSKMSADNNDLNKFNTNTTISHQSLPNGSMHGLKNTSRISKFLKGLPFLRSENCKLLFSGSECVRG